MIHYLLLRSASPSPEMELQFSFHFSRGQFRDSSRETARSEKGYLPWAR